MRMRSEVNSRSQPPVNSHSQLRIVAKRCETLRITSPWFAAYPMRIRNSHARRVKENSLWELVKNNDVDRVLGQRDCRDCNSRFSKFCTTSARILWILDAADIYLWTSHDLGIYIHLFSEKFEHLSSLFTDAAVGCSLFCQLLAVPGIWVIVTQDFRSSAQRQPESFGFSM